MPSQFGTFVLSFLLLFGGQPIRPALVADSGMITQTISTTTTTTQDVTPPSVIAFSTTNQTDGTIIAIIQFSEPLDTSRFTPSSLYIIDTATGQQLAVSVWAVSPDTASVKLTYPAGAGASYALVAHSIRDTVGNTMADWTSPAFQLPDTVPATQTTVSTTTSTTDISTATSSAATSPSDITPPSVISISVSTQPDGTLRAGARFSEPVDPSSLSASSVYIVDASTKTRFPGAIVSTGSDSVAYQSSSPALFLIDYRLLLHGIRDLAGNQMSEYLSPLFQRTGTAPASTTTTTATTATTAPSAVDTTAPGITDFMAVPEPDGSLAAYARFNEPVDVAALTLSNVYIARSSDGAKQQTTLVFAGSDGVKVRLAFPALPGVDYNLIVRGVRDLAGNHMPEYRSPSFRLPSTGDTVPLATTSAPKPTSEVSAQRTIAPTEVAPPPPVTIRQAQQLGELNTSVRTLEQVSMAPDATHTDNPPVAPDLSGAGDRTLGAVSDLESPKDVQVARDALAARDGIALYEDTDHDGVSNYDEVHIYHTDPNSARTVGGGLTDGEKILRGIDPLSSSQEPVPVQSPQTSGFTVDGLFSVDSISRVPAAAASSSAAVPVAVVSTTTVTEPPNPATSAPQDVRFTGRALPNSFVTLYIFSTPIVVTVKSDDTGRWTYTLDKELPDGDHELYVAMVDNSGAIIAKSPAVPFTKTAEALDFTPLSLPPIDENGSRRTLMYELVLLGTGAVLVMFGIIVLGAGMLQRQKTQAV